MEQQFNYFVWERRPEGNISTSDWWFNKTSEKIAQRSSPNIIALIKLGIRLPTNVHGKEESTGFWTEDVKERDNLEDLNINMRIILKWILYFVDRAFLMIHGKWPTWRTILFYVFISLLYMFRATSCSTSGESIVSIQPLVYVILCRWTWRTILFYVFISILYMFQATSCSASGESIVSVQPLVYVTVCRFVCRSDDEHEVARNM